MLSSLTCRVTFLRLVHARVLLAVEIVFLACLVYLVGLSFEIEICFKCFVVSLSLLVISNFHALLEVFFYLVHRFWVHNVNLIARNRPG
jgi:hypothetical protein